MPWAGLWGALAVDAAAAALVYAALGRGRAWRRWGTVAAALAAAVAPRLVGGPTPRGRFFVALLSVVLMVKFYDLGVTSLRPGWRRPSWLAYLAFLPNPFALVYRTLDREPRPPRSEDRARLGWGALGLGLGLAVAWGVFRADWSGAPLVVEHPAKVLALYAPLLGLDAAGVALLRLAGGRGRSVMNHPYAARTPAEFWRRYNRPVNHFLNEDVFRAAGARGSPAVGVLAAFLVSAAAHEYLFGVTLGRVEGFQSAFFLVQGLAVAATIRVRPKGVWGVAGWALTWALLLSTSLLFFASLGGVFPFYAPGRPAWLRPRP